jgi:ribulose-phosphate 3-epimerase
MVKIYPSLMLANILELKKEIEKLAPHCDGFHLDVMDFHFVPNLTFGPHIINSIAKASSKELFVHLMVEHPEKLIEYLQLPEGSIVAFHKTTVPKVSSFIKQIKKRGWRASLALDPDESIDNALSVINDLDQVLVMSVRPGFSGQEFIAHTLKKAQEINRYRTQHEVSFRIAMDGGIDHENIVEIVEAGVDDIALASAIFKSGDPVKALKKLRLLIKSS